MTINNVVALEQHNYSFETLFKSKINLNKYKNNFSTIERFKGKVLMGGLTNINNIEISKGSHQTRANDYDVGHVKRLAQQIGADGLTNVPIVEWCSDIEKFCVLSGHHRIYAMKELGYENIPVCVVKFSNHMKKAFWLQWENKHEAAKEHSTKDAEKFICDLRQSGFKSWDSRKPSEEEAIKSEVYAALFEAGYTFGGKSKKDIFVRAFSDFKRSTITTVDSKEADKSALAIFNQPKDKWLGNKYVIASGMDASRKCLMVAARERSEYIYLNKINPYEIPESEVSILTYFPAAYKEKRAFTRQRIDYLEKIKILNVVLLKNINLTVDKIVFQPQFKGKNTDIETAFQHYRWDKNTSNFIKE